MDNSQSDKAVSDRWRAWALKENLRLHTTGTFDSPTTVHTSVPSPLSPSDINSTQTHGVQSNRNQLGFLLPDPPQCFCKKTAYLSYNLEYGPTLDCASYGDENQNSDGLKTTCGFHVHKISWDKMRSYIKAGSLIHAKFNELRTCSLYNYTFCNIFHLTNSYDKTPPHMLPKCCCGYPVKLGEKKIGGFFSFFFSCKNLFASGDICRMCWFLDANKVVFAKPNCLIHKHVGLETYQIHQQGQRDILETFVHQHRSNLLAALSSGPSTIYSSVIPASISEANQQSTSFEPTPQKTTSELQEEADSLKHSLSKIKQDMKLCLNRFKAQAPKYIEEAIHLGSEREIELRINGQQRLSEVEAELAVQMLRSENQAKEFEYYKAKMLEKYGDKDEYKKCKVCYSRDIEYILIPCFHYAYCGLCAGKLKECAICRKDIITTHRVYSC